MPSWVTEGSRTFAVTTCQLWNSFGQFRTPPRLAGSPRRSEKSFDNSCPTNWVSFGVSTCTRNAGIPIDVSERSADDRSFFVVDGTITRLACLHHIRMSGCHSLIVLSTLCRTMDLRPNWQSVFVIVTVTKTVQRPEHIFFCFVFSQSMRELRQPIFCPVFLWIWPTTDIMDRCPYCYFLKANWFSCNHFFFK